MRTHKFSFYQTKPIERTYGCLTSSSSYSSCFIWIRLLPPTPTDTCTHLERQGYHLSEAVISWCTAPTVAPHSQPDLWGNYGKNVCLSIPGVERTDRDIKQITLYTKWNVMAADQERSLCVVIRSSLIEFSFPVSHTHTHTVRSVALGDRPGA